MSPGFRSLGMNSGFLVNHITQMHFLDLIVLGLRQRNVLFSFSGRPGSHKILEAGPGEDRQESDIDFANIIDNYLRVGRNEHSSASVYFSDRVSQMHSSSSTLQEEDFVCAGMSMCMDRRRGARSP